MHHLFPVRASANSARNNFPYADVDDTLTNVWYYDVLSEEFPSQDINKYSELDIRTPAFEPREDHKGNAARAIFYFYTMYKEHADAADPSFFARQVSTLCQWHLDDPVDSLEWERNLIIAAYQDNKTNPFILDCSLPYRSYCPYITHNSCFTTVKTLANFGTTLFPAYPNPCTNLITISYELETDLEVSLNVYNAQGQELWVHNKSNNQAGFHQRQIDVSALPKGIYFYRIQFHKGVHRLPFLKQFVVGE